MAQIKTTAANLTVGVLALQGDFERHRHQFDLLGVRSSEVRLPGHLNGLAGLVIPGGESTTMDKLLDRFELRGPLLDFAATRPVFGTCAGMVMLSKKVEDNQSKVTPLGLIDIDVVRNGYGRQLYSFQTELEADLGGEPVKLKGTFIRAPGITRIGKGVVTLAVYRGSPVLVCEGRVLAGSFHTELDDDTTLLEFFMQKFLLPGTDKSSR